MGDAPARLKPKPHEYLQAIARRARRLDGVHACRPEALGRPGFERATLWVTFEGEGWEPSPELAESVQELCREFSAAFTQWGIGVMWQKHVPFRVQKVVYSFIEGDRVVQELECGHRMDAGRLKVKRRCDCCSREEPTPTRSGEE